MAELTKKPEKMLEGGEGGSGDKTTFEEGD